MGEEVLSKLVEFIESASPVIWETARRQVVVDLVQSVVWLVICAVIAYFSCTKWIPHLWRKHKEHKFDGYDIAAVLLTIGAVIAALAAVGLLTHVVGVAVNPNYYAIRLLLGYVQ